MGSWLCKQMITPGSSLFVAGAENHLVASSIGHSRRTGFGVLKRMVSGMEYRVSDNRNEARIEHVPSQTSVSVLPAGGKSALGLLHARYIVCDEPSSWRTSDGEIMFQAIQTSLAKPGVDLKILYLGTLAPALDERHWYRSLVAKGSGEGVHVQCVQPVDPERWDHWSEIKRCNPLSWKFPKSRKLLLAERDAARGDERLKSRFCSFRLNMPVANEESMLLTVADWKKVISRSPQPRRSRPIIGMDVSHTKSWTGVVAIWPATMRTEAWGVCPDIPIRKMEIADRVPKGSYQRLVDEGSLIVDHGRTVPRLDLAWDIVRKLHPLGIFCDRFRIEELTDVVRGACEIQGIMARWSDSTRMIRSLRALALDGDLNVALGSRKLLELSLAQARVKPDSSGNVRLLKGGGSRKDDVAAAFLLASSRAEKLAKYQQEPTLRWSSVA